MKVQQNPDRINIFFGQHACPTNTECEIHGIMLCCFENVLGFVPGKKRFRGQPTSGPKPKHGSTTVVLTVVHHTTTSPQVASALRNIPSLLGLGWGSQVTKGLPYKRSL